MIADLKKDAADALAVGEAELRRLADGAVTLIKQKLADATSTLRARAAMLELAAPAASASELAVVGHVTLWGAPDRVRVSLGGSRGDGEMSGDVNPSADAIRDCKPGVYAVTVTIRKIADVPSGG